MKAFIQLLLLVILISMASVVQSSAQIQNDIRTKNRIEVIFNHKLNAKDLENIRMKLLEHGITLRYDYLDFDRKGRLISIGFTVDCKDGFSGKAETTGLTKDSKFGFFRDYAADATATKSPFRTGELGNVE